MIVEELIALLGFEMKGEHNLSRFQRGLQSVRQKLSDFAVVAAKFAAAAGAALGTGMTMLGKSVISTGAEFEKLETTLTTIEGSSDKAKAALDWVSDFAATTPYELNEVAEAFIRMRAYGLDPMSGQLKGIGDAASAMGKGLMQGVEAIADAVTGENERLKEFGIRASTAGDQITYSWQQNGETLTKTVKKNGTEIVAALMEIFSRFDGAMDAQSRTWSGMMSNLSDQWTAFKKVISDAGFFEFAKAQVRSVMDVFDRWWKDGTIDRIGASFSDFFIASSEAMLRFGRLMLRIGRWIGRQFDNLGGVIADSLRNWTGGAIDLSNLEALAAAGAALLAVFAPWTAALIAAFLVLDDLLAYLEGGPSIIGEWIDKLPDFTAALDELAPGFKSAAEAASAAFREGDWRGVGAAIVDMVMAGVSSLGDALSGHIAGIKDDLGKIDWFAVGKQAAESIIAGVASIDWAALGERIGANAASIGVSVGSAIIGGIWQAFRAFSGITQGIASALVNIDWASIGSAWLAAIRAQIELVLGFLNGLAGEVVAIVSGWFDIDLTGIGARLGRSLLDGIRSIAGDIRAWFESILPDWARGFIGDLRGNQERANADSAGARIGGMVPPAAPAEEQAAGSGKQSRLPDRATDRNNQAHSNVPAVPPAAPAEEQAAGSGKQSRLPDRATDRINQAHSNVPAIDPALAARIAQIAEKMSAVTGDQAIEQTVSTVANDNRVTNVDVSAPVTINATTNASPEAIGAAAGGAVRNAGRDVGRSLAVTGSPAGGGPR